MGGEAAGRGESRDPSSRWGTVLGGKFQPAASWLPCDGAHPTPAPPTADMTGDMCGSQPGSCLRLTARLVLAAGLGRW